MRGSILSNDDDVVVDVILDGVEGFIQNAFLNQHKRVQTKLRKLLHLYPELVKITLNDDNEYEICLYRHLLIEKLERDDKLGLNILSFERDLKRANFYCAQTTHGYNPWKIFRLRKKVKKLLFFYKARFNLSHKETYVFFFFV